MAKIPDDQRPPRKAKDPARPTRAKAARPDMQPLAPALAELLNPAIARGTAGVGSQTGLTPPPDNSRDRRADFAAAHTARKSARPDSGRPLPGPPPQAGEGEKGFAEAPQAFYRDDAELREASPELARALGLTDDNASAPSPRPNPGLPGFGPSRKQVGQA